ncbi:DEK domain-containing chromatin associated protein [Raphanus sativus]|nr:DEK domain-containing chromatin associated protein [Raphanus sativus]
MIYTQEEVAVKVLEFLESPKATRDVILADQEKEAKMRKSTQKRRKSGESSDTPVKRKRQIKKRDHTSDKDEEDSDSEGAKETHEEEDMTMRKPKLKMRETKQKLRSHLKRLKQRAQGPKPASSLAKKQKVGHDESSIGKSKKQLIKPQTKRSKEKGKAEPTREEMLGVVSKMLKEVDFNTATLSGILQKLSKFFEFAIYVYLSFQNVEELFW